MWPPEVTLQDCHREGPVKGEGIISQYVLPSVAKHNEKEHLHIKILESNKYI